MADMSAGNIYLNVVTRINDDYADLLGHLRDMDTRVAYLKIFEMSLSPALPNPLWEVKEYVRQSKLTPMPQDPWSILSFEEFRGWMTVYEMVMRRQGLIGTRKQTILGMDDETEEVNERERERVPA